MPVATGPGDDVPFGATLGEGAVAGPEAAALGPPEGDALSLLQPSATNARRNEAASLAGEQ